MSAAERVCRGAYAAIGLAAVVVFAALGVVRRWRGSARWQDAAERLGRVAKPRWPEGSPVVWLHAASVGEVGAAATLLEPLRQRLPGSRVLLTCQTATGRATAQQSGFDAVRYFPVDCRMAVDRVLDAFRPRVFLSVETEIWPRLLLELERRGIPAAMVSARVSPRSFRRYRALRALFAAPLASLARVCARDEESLSRLIELGVAAERAAVCGDLKLDRASPSGARADLGWGGRLLAAISTHDGEDSIVLDAFAEVRRVHPDVRLALAPRHPQRFPDVTALASDRWRTKRWSELDDEEGGDWDVLIIDTLGEAAAVLANAACAFVGGSFVAIGGHNLAEPAELAVPTATGPHLENIPHQRGVLSRAGALHVVADAAGLASCWLLWLGDTAAARDAGERARSAFAAERGAVARTLSMLSPVLDSIREARAAPVGR